LFAVLFIAFGLSQAVPLDGDVIGGIDVPFIVGGERASIADFPWSLALHDRIRGGYMCGASNIHRLWALSAAHCLDGGTPFTMIELYGGSDSRLVDGHLFFIDRYDLHPRYNRATIDFDIAIIRIADGTPLEGFPNVSPIPLPPSCAADCCGVCVEGPNVYVAGWGRVDDGSLPEHLMVVDKEITRNSPECVAYWQGVVPINDRMFCTTIENGRDSCNGDSGSGVVRNVGTVATQVGVVSFGSPVCGDGSRPAVYVRIEHPEIRSWITDFTGF